jgi:hypothetical protein
MPGNTAASGGSEGSRAYANASATAISNAAVIQAPRMARVRGSHHGTFRSIPG